MSATYKQNQKTICKSTLLLSENLIICKLILASSFLVQLLTCVSSPALLTQMADTVV